MTLYVVVHWPDKDRYVKYEGMSDGAVFALVAEYGQPFEFVDEATYRANA